jgi:hypothetical protein
MPCVRARSSRIGVYTSGMNPESNIRGRAAGPAARTARGGGKPLAHLSNFFSGESLREPHKPAEPVVAPDDTRSYRKNRRCLLVARPRFAVQRAYCLMSGSRARPIAPPLPATPGAADWARCVPIVGPKECILWPLHQDCLGGTQGLAGPGGSSRTALSSRQTTS